MFNYRWFHVVAVAVNVVVAQTKVLFSNGAFIKEFRGGGEQNLAQNGSFEE